MLTAPIVKFYLDRLSICRDVDTAVMLFALRDAATEEAKKILRGVRWKEYIPLHMLIGYGVTSTIPAPASLFDEVAILECVIMNNTPMNEYFFDLLRHHWERVADLIITRAWFEPLEYLIDAQELIMAGAAVRGLDNLLQFDVMRKLSAMPIIVEYHRANGISIPLDDFSPYDLDSIKIHNYKAARAAVMHGTMSLTDASNYYDEFSILSVFYECYELAHNDTMRGRLVDKIFAYDDYRLVNVIVVSDCILTSRALAWLINNNYTPLNVEQLHNIRGRGLLLRYLLYDGTHAHSVLYLLSLEEYIELAANYPRDEFLQTILQNENCAHLLPWVEPRRNFPLTDHSLLYLIELGHYTDLDFFVERAKIQFSAQFVSMYWREAHKHSLSRVMAFLHKCAPDQRNAMAAARYFLAIDANSALSNYLDAQIDFTHEVAALFPDANPWQFIKHTHNHNVTEELMRKALEYDLPPDFIDHFDCYNNPFIGLVHSRADILDKLPPDILCNNNFIYSSLTYARGNTKVRDFLFARFYYTGNYPTDVVLEYIAETKKYNNLILCNALYWGREEIIYALARTRPHRWKIAYNSMYYAKYSCALETLHAAAKK